MNKEMELLRIFRVAAESSSFRDAAVRLGTSPQGVTRAIQQLEQHYGEVLFHRSTLSFSEDDCTQCQKSAARSFLMLGMFQ
ncbi:LysR family transcriptional regulator, partial [Pseudomonas aeruginosa]|uniref:LysR family transcriptional regulator n=1 Tax=Pseudomonas aeruginosa TaxID=287 RepID=UPI0021AB678B